MTDPKPTTNEEIALKRGWKKTQGDRVTPYFWLWTDGSTRRKPPDFEHDWAHAGPLWAELVAALTLPGAANSVWGRLAAGVGWCPSQDELMVATCRAWLAWQKEEKDGT